MPAFRLATRKPDLHVLHYWKGTQTGLYPCFYAIMLRFVDEKLQKLQSGWGSAPDPDGGAYSAPPYPLAGREGATPPPAPTPALNQFHLIAFPNPPVSRPAYGPDMYGVCNRSRSQTHLRKHYRTKDTWERFRDNNRDVATYCTSPIHVAQWTLCMKDRKYYKRHVWSKTTAVA